MKKLNQNGLTHFILPLVAIVVIGGIGGYMLTKSHADVDYAATCGNGYKFVQRSIGKYSDMIIYNKPAVSKYCLLVASRGASEGVSKPMSATLSLTVDNDKNGSTTNNTILKTNNAARDSKTYVGPVYISYEGFKLDSSKVGGYAVIAKGKTTYKNVTDKFEQDLPY